MFASSARRWTGILVLALGFVNSPAQAAWTPEGGSTVVLPGAVRSLAVGTWGDRPAVAAVGETQTWVVDPRSGDVIATAASGGQAVALEDHDGDGRADLLLCTASGLRLVPGTDDGFGAVRPLTRESCAAFATYDHSDGSRGVVTASTILALWRVGDGGALSGPSRFGNRLEGAPVVVSEGPRFAVFGKGGTQVVERSEWGRSVYNARGPIGGLAMGPRSWAWTQPDAAVVEDVTRRRIPVAPEPGLLRGADLDGDGTVELLVVHPEQLGVVVGDSEHLHPLPEGTVDLLVVDLEGDGCQDVVLARAEELQVLPGQCGAASQAFAVVEEPVTGEEPGPAPSPAASATPLVLGGDDLRVDVVAGDTVWLRLVDPAGAATRFSARGGPADLVVDAFGVARYTAGLEDVGEWVVSVRMWGGSEIVRVIPFRLVVHSSDDTIPAPPGDDWVPQLVVSREHSEVQVVAGQSMVLQLVDEEGRAETWSLMDGPPGLRMNQLGLVTYDAVPEHVGEWDVQVRMKSFRVERYAHFQLSVVSREAAAGLSPGGDTGGAPDADTAAAVDGEEVVPEPRRQTFWTVRSCVVAFGIAAGASNGNARWQDVGRTMYYSVSPAMAGVCEGGSPKGLKWFAGADTAPIFAYLLSPEDIGVHTLVGTAGLALGSETARVGPFVSMGILLSGVGLRASWLPFQTRHGQRQGFEFRFSWLASRTTSVQGMLLYGFRLHRFR
jgi:hypothetical protein